MKNKILILSCLISLLSFTSYAQGDLKSLVIKADSAYASKDYGEAVRLYSSIAEQEGTSVALLYNLGNSYFQEGDYGNAMVCYQRARRLDPSNKEVNANIKYLSSRVEDANKAEQKGRRLKVGADEPSFFQTVHKSVASDTSTDTWAVWGAVSFILFTACLALYIFTRNVALRKTGFFGGIVLLSASILFVVFSFMSARAFHSESEGVLTGFKTVLQTEPGKESGSGKNPVLTKGTIVRILSEEVDAEGNVTFYKVRLNSDYIGWVAASELTVI